VEDPVEVVVELLALVPSEETPLVEVDEATVPVILLLAAVVVARQSAEPDLALALE
jgi:hypothetical protein